MCVCERESERERERVQQIQYNIIMQSGKMLGERRRVVVVVVVGGGGWLRACGYCIIRYT